MTLAAIAAGKVTRLVVAIVSMIGGCALVFSLLLLMNSQNQPPPKEEVSSQAMTVEASKKKPKKPRKPKPRPRRKATKSRSKPAPVPQLSTALSGMSFGLPSLSGVDLTRAADEILGDEAVTDAVMNAATVDERPEPRRQIKPTYPSRARSKNVEGYVVISMLIGKDGRVSKLKVLESEPPGVFDDVVLEAARGWEFDPATYRGQAVAMRATQRVPFKLGD